VKKIFLGLLCLVTIPVFAQRLSVDFLGGVSNYQGDLQESRFTFNQGNAAFGVGLSYQITNHLSIRGMGTFGRIQADDRFNRDSFLVKRNLNFHSKIYDLSLTGVYDFLDLSTHRVTPYVLAGLALFHFNPYSTDALGAEVNLRSLGTEGQGLAAYPDRKVYNLNQLSIPFGGGVRFAVTNNIILGFELRLHKTFTDYLDDVSTNYVDEATLLAARGQQSVDFAFRGDELKNPLPYPADGTKRGSPEFKDWYYFTGLTLSLRLPGRGEGSIFSTSGRHGSSRLDCPVNVH